MSEEKCIIFYEIKVIKDFNLMIFVFVWIFVVDLLVCVCILFERLVIKKKRERKKENYVVFCFILIYVL